MPRDAKAYASALFDSPGNASAKERRASALEALAGLIGGDGRSVGRFVRDPGVAADDKGLALASLAEDDSAWTAFCSVLAKDGAWDKIAPIARKYRAFVDREAGTERAIIETARPLPEATRESIAEAWRAARGATRVIVSEIVKPSLLGGFRFRAGSIRYDMSVAGKLERLRAALAEPLRRGSLPSGGAG